MPEPKQCPRCNAPFECQPENITQCQCYGITLTDAARGYIAGKFEDCLCRKCLEEVQINLSDELGRLNVN